MNQIKARREALRLSREELAQLTGTAASTIARYERGYPPLIHTREHRRPSEDKLVEFFGVGEELLSDQLFVPSGPVIDTTGEAPPTPEEALDEKEMAQAMRKILATLTPREEWVIRQRFGIGLSRDHTLEDVGAKLGHTRERIRQIEAKALRKLRQASRVKHIKFWTDRRTEGQIDRRVAELEYFTRAKLRGAEEARRAAMYQNAARILRAIAEEDAKWAAEDERRARFRENRRQDEERRERAHQKRLKDRQRKKVDFRKMKKRPQYAGTPTPPRKRDLFAREQMRMIDGALGFGEDE